MAADTGPGTLGGVDRLRVVAGTVRVRTTAAAVGVGGLALLIASVTLVTLLQLILAADVAESTRISSVAIRAQVGASGHPSGLSFPDDEDQLVQIVDAGGSVIAASPDLEGFAPIAAATSDEAPREIALQIDDQDGRFLVLAAEVTSPDGTFTVIVARPLEDVTETTQTVTNLLVVGVPLLLVVVALTTWWVVGGALAPVEAIRREVDGISAGELHRRVPVPTGGDEIAGLAGTMNRMLGRLEEAQLRQRRFVSDASHELRSPVASIRQHAEVASAHPERTTLAELADTVLVEDLRLQRLVEDLLLLARADERTLVGTRAQVDLDDLVSETARRLRGDPRLSVDTTGVGAGRVRGDPSLLARLVGNLADNAAHHARGRVALSLVDDGAGQVMLWVDDDGPGIPLAERARVFERFVRLDDARTRDRGGAGLGLAIVAEVAALHGGTVIADASPLGGARLEVRLPSIAD